MSFKDAWPLYEILAARIRGWFNWWRQNIIHWTQYCNSIPVSKHIITQAQEYYIYLPNLAVVLQIIAYDKAYSLYPYSTFENRTSLWMAEPRGADYLRNAAIIVKYANRGFNFVPTTLTGNAHIFALNERRTVGDSHTWTISLDTEGVVLRNPMTPTSPAFTFDPVTQCSWILGFQSTNLVMKYTVFRHFCLRYAYLATCSMETRLLQHYLDEQEKLERYKAYLQDLSDGSDKAYRLITWCVAVISAVSSRYLWYVLKRWDAYLPLCEKEFLPDIYRSGDSGLVPTMLNSPFEYVSDDGTTRKRRRMEFDSVISDMDSEFWYVDRFNVQQRTADWWVPVQCKVLHAPVNIISNTVLIYQCGCIAIVWKLFVIVIEFYDSWAAYCVNRILWRAVCSRLLRSAA